MTDTLRIRMFGGFNVFVNDNSIDATITKSKKGLAFLQYLILKHGSVIPNQKLIKVLWPNEESGNPENALKTLVSRFRMILNQCSPELGNSIVAGRGGYQFVKLPNMTVDIFDFEDCVIAIEESRKLASKDESLYERVLAIYTGDLLEGNDQDDWSSSVSVHFHELYIKIIYEYLNLLKEKKNYGQIIQVCRFALETDPFDEKLHLELMQALVSVNRNNEALMQYKHVTNMHFRYLGVTPPEGIQAFYKHVIKADEILDQSMNAVRRELWAYGDVHGAYECEYAVFREIYSLQMRNLERLGSSMYIAVIMITSMDSEPIALLTLDETMKALGDVLKRHLRKGDTITRFSTAQYAVLLPTVNMDSGRMVIERIKRFFYQKCPTTHIMFNFRLAALSPQMNAREREKERYQQESWMKQEK